MLQVRLFKEATSTTLFLEIAEWASMTLQLQVLVAEERLAKLHVNRGLQEALSKFLQHFYQSVIVASKENSILQFTFALENVLEEMKTVHMFFKEFLVFHDRILSGESEFSSSFHKNAVLFTFVLNFSEMFDCEILRFLLVEAWNPLGKFLSNIAFNENTIGLSGLWTKSKIGLFEFPKCNFLIDSRVEEATKTALSCLQNLKVLEKSSSLKEGRFSLDLKAQLPLLLEIQSQTQAFFAQKKSLLASSLEAKTREDELRIETETRLRFEQAQNATQRLEKELQEIFRAKVKKGKEKEQMRLVMLEEIRKREIMKKYSRLIANEEELSAMVYFLIQLSSLISAVSLSKVEKPQVQNPMEIEFEKVCIEEEKEPASNDPSPLVFPRESKWQQREESHIRQLESLSRRQMKATRNKWKHLKREAFEIPKIEGASNAKVPIDFCFRVCVLKPLKEQNEITNTALCHELYIECHFEELLEKMKERFFFSKGHESLIETVFMENPAEISMQNLNAIVRHCEDFFLQGTNFTFAFHHNLPHSFSAAHFALDSIGFLRMTTDKKILELLLSEEVLNGVTMVMGFFLKVKYVAFVLRRKWRLLNKEILQKKSRVANLCQVIRHKMQAFLDTFQNFLFSFVTEGAFKHFQENAREARCLSKFIELSHDFTRSLLARTFQQGVNVNVKNAISNLLTMVLEFNGMVKRL